MPKYRTRWIAALAGLLFCTALAAGLFSTLVSAGPLDPPAGAVSSTLKTLAEVEPRIAINATNTPGDADSLFKISAPGSYYLTGNIRGVVLKHGVEITANGVTLDLNGFDLVGIPKMGAVDGVSATVGGLSNIAVVNGSVRGWGDEGVDLGTANVSNCRVQGVLASGNSSHGIYAGSAGTVANCSAYQNNAAGILTLSGGTASCCSAYENGTSGIATANGSTITHCSAYQNTGTGISAGTGCTVSNCSVFGNGASGISVSSGCTVADCTSRGNTLDGIVCTFACVIRGNTCSSNGTLGDGAGIHATIGDDRIEGNNCTSADRGIDIDGPGNIIIRNSCSGNTIDWVIVANNIYGPIIDRRVPASAAVSGFGAVTTLGSTDPNANFSY
jgi:parallel beta-helix repeat protein